MNTLYHIKVCHKIFGKYLSPKALDIVIRYNFNTDFYSSIGWKTLQHKVYPLFPIARHWYKNYDHFDEMNDSADVVATWHKHHGLIMELVDDAKYPTGKPSAIWRILGRSSHALSDISSHTNCVHLLKRYYTNEPGARREAEASGKSVDDFLRDCGPAFGSVITDAKFADFREKYMSELFAYQAIVDKGPRSHRESGVDSPKSLPCEADPKLFEISLGMSVRNSAQVIDEFFGKLKEENPEKFKALTEVYRDAEPDNGAPGKYARRAEWWAKKVGGWD